MFSFTRESSPFKPPSGNATPSTEIDGGQDKRSIWLMHSAPAFAFGIAAVPGSELVPDGGTDTGTYTGGSCGDPDVARNIETEC